jgi:hypothetical protein
LSQLPCQLLASQRPQLSAARTNYGLQQADDGAIKSIVASVIGVKEQAASSFDLKGVIAEKWIIQAESEIGEKV